MLCLCQIFLHHLFHFTDLAQLSIINYNPFHDLVLRYVFILLDTTLTTLTLVFMIQGVLLNMNAIDQESKYDSEEIRRLATETFESQ